MASIRFDEVSKTYAGGHHALHALDLTAADGEFLVLVGPSGCGKSTALRLVAGLETPTAGSIAIGGRDVTALPPQVRDVAMVFQSYALYPHLTVRENLGFGLKMRGTPRDVARARVEEVARTLGLAAVLDRKPAALSGGQRQRVALGRAIVREPQAFLLDEPLSNLDALLRLETRVELARLHRRLGATVLYVTHDQEEAMTLGDRVAVLRDGRLQQVAPPMELYQRPANRFVAGFVGSPAMNFLPGDLLGDVGGGAGTVLGVRPHDLTIVSPGEGGLDARVDVVERRGSDSLIYARLDGRLADYDLRIIAPPDIALGADARIGVVFTRHALHCFDAADGRRISLEDNIRRS